MLASFLKRDLRNLFRKDASPNFQAQNGLLSLRSRWRSVRSLFYWTQELAMVPSTNRHSYGSKIRSLKRKYAARIVNGYRKLPCWRSGYRMAWDDRSGDREAG